MKSNCTKLIALTLILVFTITAPACVGGSGPSDEEIISYVSELIPKAAELNEIYYGSGLPTLEAQEGAVYLQLSEDSRYSSADELYAATKGVFSDDLAETMYSVGVQGVYNDENEEFDLVSRYTVVVGQFVMRASMSEPIILLGREFDLSTIKVLRSRKKYAMVSVMSVKNGEQKEVELKIVPAGDVNGDGEDDGWRLDTPTY